ncbi:MAG: EAL domain-containing protein [Actinomycetia bacterium]|nr:EAL domain-containing protein [Actinomycetes bacterium]MCP4959751.1 EAL domain-containing protein [Actinomycetes bacterium]
MVSPLQTSQLRHPRSSTRLPATVTRRVLASFALLRLSSATVGMVFALVVRVAGDYDSDASRLVAVAVALAAVAIPWNVYLLRSAANSARWPWLWAPVDVLITAGLAAIAPAAVWPVGALIILATVALESVRSGRTAGLVTSLAATVALAAGGVATGSDLVGFVIPAFALAAFLEVAAIGSLSDEQHTTLRRLGAMLDGVPGIVWEADAADHRMVFVSGRVRDVLGYSPLEFSKPGMTWADLIHPDDQHTLIDTSRIDSMSWPHVREFRMRARDGDWVWLRDLVRAERRADGSWALRGVATDITPQREADDRAMRFTRFVDEIDAPVLVMRLDDLADERSLRVLRSNAAANRWTSHGPLDGFLAIDVDWLVSAGLTETVASVVRTGEAHAGKEVAAPVPAADGSVFDVEIKALGDGCAAVIYHDATMRVASRDALRREALQDPLTGLPNRAHLMERLRRHVGHSENDAPNLALIVLDLDQFKEVNDTLGHHHGDALLRQVAARLGDLRRGSDLVARLGGDEFAVLLVDDGVERAPGVASAIVDTIGEPLTLQGLQVQAAASIGLASHPHHASAPDELLQRAEVAMYQAKATRKSWAWYSPKDDKYSVRRLTLLGELPRALANNEIIVHYQPKIDLAHGVVMGVEALVRWQHPELGTIRPDEFIELTEVSGLVNELTRQVLERSIEQLRQWDQQGIHIDVAVNLSVRNFHDAGLASFISDVLDRTGVSASRLMLEITESQVVDDLALAADVLRSLSDLGIRTSIDDFGTGFSSLTHLRRLPIDEIKIDRSFVGQMATNEHDAVIVRSIVRLGHDLDLEVVAEGVEDEWTLESLRRLGCDRAQGYFFQRPVPPDEIPEFVGKLAALAR